MSEKKSFCKKLLLLIGSNPIPNFLAALILNPESICFFYSPESEPVKDYLHQKLKDRLENIEITDIRIDNATDPSKVRKAFASISAAAHLHYTGGTKTMAAHARLAFRDAGGTDEQASYLDERNAVLRFDDGYEIPETKWDFKLTIDEILGLHGIRIASTEGKKHLLTKNQNLPIVADAEKIAEAVLNDPCLANRLYNVNRADDQPRSFLDAKACPVKMDDLVSGLTIKRLPEIDCQKIAFKQWCKFLEGGWLEVWCGGLVHDILKESEVHVSVNCKRENGRKLEIDLAFIRRHRLFVVSCTTDTKIRLCKSKLFEVAMRARQLGGDLARSALVCLIYDSNEDGLYVDQLRNDVDDIWDASNTPKVFGLDNLKEWAGIHGEPNTGTLQQWLES